MKLSWFWFWRRWVYTELLMRKNGDRLSVWTGDELCFCGRIFASNFFSLASVYKGLVASSPTISPFLKSERSDWMMQKPAALSLVPIAIVLRALHRLFCFHHSLVVWERSRVQWGTFFYVAWRITCIQSSQPSFYVFDISLPENY